MPDGLAGSSGSDWYASAKPVIDGVAVLLLLALTGPVILAVMVLVKLTSRGPALYTQMRLGRDARPYRIYKIRTMTHDCERATGPRWSSGSDDPRVTPLGRVLRRTHLDELPQLWNVVRGEMSLVGPRPELPEFVGQLARALPDYGHRLRVRPGITGLAQVQLPPDVDLSGVRRKLARDLYYVRRVGPWLDLRILLATAMKVAGAPFGTTRQLLALPGLEDIAMDDAAGARSPAPAEERPRRAMQTI